MSKSWTQTVSYYFPTQADLMKSDSMRVAVEIPNNVPNPATGQIKTDQAIARNLSNYLTPIQLSRLKVDLAEWRRAIDESELAYYPHRVRMQRMFIDTILNGHVYGIMEMRKDLTLLRDYKLVKLQGSQWVPSEDLKQQFEEYTWFNNYMAYVLDAMFFGYSLISLGDIIDGNFAECDVIRRWNVSPDRQHVTSIIYSLAGRSWNDPDTQPWHVWVPTPTENGVGKCGYGLFYKIALYEIFLRNTLGYNADFVELYSQPYRVGKTTKTTEGERAELEAAVRNMGSNGYAIIDPLDEIQFLETALGGTGWQGYDNFETRCMKMISKIVLGHADAMDSIPGKLGNNNGDSPVEKAKKAKQVKDGKFVQPNINNQLFPRMKKFGIGLPEGYKFVFNNDDEKEEMRQRQDDSNQKTAAIAQTMSTAGLKMDPKYFEERTGIPTSEVEQPEPDDDDMGDKPNDKPDPEKKKAVKDRRIKNLMADLYGK